MLVGLAVVLAQATLSLAADQQQTTLYVVVRDKAGKPVSGLPEQAFTALDNKEPQKIISFKAVSGSADAPVEAVIVLDAVNAGFNTVGYLREELKKFLLRDEGRLAIPTSIAFFTDSGMKLPTGNSPNGNELVKILDANETGLRSSRRSQGLYGAADRAQLSLRALGGLAQFEANRPGRKIVVWISPGWALLSGPYIQMSERDHDQIFDSIVGLSTALKNAGITLYSVDPLGTADAATGRTFYYQEYLKPILSPRNTDFGDLALQVFATHSGGRVLNSSNDVSQEIETAYRDGKNYYAISIATPSADRANDYHSIEVKVAQPDVKVQTLTGFYANPTPVEGH